MFFVGHFIRICKWSRCYMMNSVFSCNWKPNRVIFVRTEAKDLAHPSCLMTPQHFLKKNVWESVRTESLVTRHLLNSLPNLLCPVIATSKTCMKCKSSGCKLSSSQLTSKLLLSPFSMTLKKWSCIIFCFSPCSVTHPSAWLNWWMLFFLLRALMWRCKSSCGCHHL